MKTEVYLKMWWVLITFLCSSALMYVFSGSFRPGAASGGGEQEGELCLLERVWPSLEILPLLSMSQGVEKALKIIVL